MKANRNLPRRRAVLAAMFVAGLLPTAAHDHLDAGALAPTAGAALTFVNGHEFIIHSGYVVALEPRWEVGSGWLAGAFTLTALPATPFTGGPLPGHAALGAQLAARIESVAGPAGARFSFWEAPDEEEAAVLRFTVPVGETAGTNLFLLSENGGVPGSDPYGHIHGRFFAADRPGLYVLGLRLVDVSANGPDGGPLHTPGEWFPLYLQAGHTIAGLERGAEGWAVTFGTALGRRYTLEAAPAVTGPWTPAAPAVAGNKHLQTLSVPDDGAARFFRLLVE